MEFLMPAGEEAENIGKGGGGWADPIKTNGKCANIFPCQVLLGSRPFDQQKSMGGPGTAWVGNSQHCLLGEGSEKASKPLRPGRQGEAGGFVCTAEAFCLLKNGDFIATFVCI